MLFRSTTYTKDDVVIEMHNYMSRMFYPVYSSRWKKYMRDVLEKESPKVDIDDCSVNVLPDTFNALYLFMHLFHHFIYSDGVGLRQFCDWALFLEKKADSIDYAEFREMSEALGLKRAVSIFGAIAIDYLGLDPEKFPFQIDEATRNMSKPVLTDILNGGSWGRNHYKDLDKDASFAQRIKYYNFRFGRAFRYGHICRKETYSFLVWRFFSAIFNLDTAED